MFYIDADVDDETDECEEETEGDEGTAPACIIGGEREDDEHDCAGDIGCHGVEIGFDG